MTRGRILVLRIQRPNMLIVRWRVRSEIIWFTGNYESRTDELRLPLREGAKIW